MTKIIKSSIYPIFVFDFDGVVCDSTDECMVTSWNAWEKWHERNNFRRTVSEFSNHEIEQFRKLRPRVRGAGEYYILRRAFSENLIIENQRSYENLEQEWHKDISAFKDVFFQMREYLRQENLKLWIDLHPIYQKVVDVMKYFSKENRLYIATLKDGESVRLIIENQSINIPADRLLDQSQITSKIQALDRIRDKLNCKKSDLLFIDDNVTHLLEPFENGYPVFLTTWNNPLDEYIEIAKLNKIPLLADCEHLLET